MLGHYLTTVSSSILGNTQVQKSFVFEKKLVKSTEFDYSTANRHAWKGGWHCKILPPITISIQYLCVVVHIWYLYVYLQLQNFFSPLLFLLFVYLMMIFLPLRWCLYSCIWWVVLKYVGVLHTSDPVVLLELELESNLKCLPNIQCLRNTVCNQFV